MKYFVFSVLISFTLSSIAHEYNTSHFLFEAAGEKLMMTASIDESSLKEILDAKMSCENEDDLSPCADRYLAKNFMTIINGDRMAIHLDSSKIEDDMFHLYYHIDFNPEDLYEVWVKTAFMTDEDELHMNEVAFDIKGRKQTMLMNIEKQVIQFYF
ncbi:MAG: hypothetical protein HKN92_12350 [Chitinophagales bacterium]|nr:hypothetical protein [Chitinophagales bacterium]